MAGVPFHLMLLTGALLLAAPAAAQMASVATPAPLPGPFFTTNPAVQASLDRLARGSRLWREAETRLRAAGGRAFILTPDQVVIADEDGPSHQRFDPSVLAAVHPMPDEHDRITVVIVVVNLRLLSEGHHRRGSVPVEVDADLDRILIHEIYGHAVPYLLAGDRSGRCPDPVNGERVADACSIQRENLVREELGLGRRSDYGLTGLALGRRGWQR